MNREEVQKLLDAYFNARWLHHWSTEKKNAVPASEARMYSAHLGEITDRVVHDYTRADEVETALRRLMAACLAEGLSEGMEEEHAAALQGAYAVLGEEAEAEAEEAETSSSP